MIKAIQPILQIPRDLRERAAHVSRLTKLALATLSASAITAGFVLGSVANGVAIAGVSLVVAVAALYFKKLPVAALPPQSPALAPAIPPRPAQIPNNNQFHVIQKELENIRGGEFATSLDPAFKEEMDDTLACIERQSKWLLEQCADPVTRSEIVHTAMENLARLKIGCQEMVQSFESHHDLASVFYIEARAFKEDQIDAFTHFIKRNLAYLNTNSQFGTVLHSVSRRNRLPFIRVLAENGADFAVRDPLFKNTALHWTIANADNTAAMEILKWLPKEQYASLNIQCEAGNTVLHLAIGKGYEHVSVDGQRLEFTNSQLAEKILEHGANPNMQNRSGNTPLHFAYTHQNKVMIDLLLKHGATKNIRNNAGQLPEDMQTLSLEKRKEILKQNVAAFLIQR